MTAAVEAVLPVVVLSVRDRAILREVAAGRAELTISAEPDLFLEGRCCCDQLAAHRLAHAGLIAPAGLALPGQRVRACLTDAGRHLQRADR